MKMSFYSRKLLIALVGLFVIIVVFFQLANKGPDMKDMLLVGASENWDVTYLLKDLNLSAEGLDIVKDSNRKISLVYRGEDDQKKFTFAYVIEGFNNIGVRCPSGIHYEVITLQSPTESYYWEIKDKEFYQIIIEWGNEFEVHREEVILKVE